MQQRERKTTFAHLQFLHTDSLSLPLSLLHTLKTTHSKRNSSDTNGLLQFGCLCAACLFEPGVFQKLSYLKTFKEYTVTHKPTDTSPTKI